MVFATERWLREGRGSCVPVADWGRRRRGRRQSSRRPSAGGRADPVTRGKCEKCSAPPVLPPHLPHLSPKSSVPERRSLPREEPRPLSDWERYGARSGADGPRRAPVVAAAQLRALGSRAGLSTPASQPASQPHSRLFVPGLSAHLKLREKSGCPRIQTAFPRPPFLPLGTHPALRMAFLVPRKVARANGSLSPQTLRV